MSPPLVPARLALPVNLPNKLTVSRMVLTVLFLAVMFTGFRGYESVAVILMWLAAKSSAAVRMAVVMVVTR